MGELTEVYEQYADQVFKYLLVLCRNLDIEEELTQETFYQAVRSIDTYNGECKMSVWLCQIAKYTYYKYVDKQVKQPQSSDLLNQLPSVENNLIESESKIELYRMIHLIEELYKEIVLLRILGSLTSCQLEWEIKRTIMQCNCNSTPKGWNIAYLACGWRATC